MTDKKYGVLLVNLGTPTAPTPKAVRQFLKNFLSDPRVVDLPRLLWLPILYGVILTFRPKRVALNYAKIWTDEGSPLMVYSLRQQQKLQALFERQETVENSPSHQFKVEFAMTYGEPSIGNASKKLVEWGADEIILLPLYPQFSYTTTAAVFDQIDIIAKQSSIQFNCINNYCDEPAYIKALGDSIRPRLDEHSKLVMSFHGIPQRLVDKGDPYQAQCEKTAQLLAAELNLQSDEWELAYQSRVGKEPWLSPYLDKRMTELSAEGTKNIVVVSPGFSVDCLETLEEIAMENREIFLEHGGESFTYVDALNASDSHIEMMAELIRKVLA